MTFENMLSFNLVLLVALISPGPALLYALRTSLASGRKAGIATGLGLACMASVWTLMALFGLDTLFKLFPWAYSGLKLAGALYLLFIAVKTWTGATQPASPATSPKARAFLGAVLVNLSNPKSVLFASAILIMIFPPDLSLIAKAAITANHLLVETIAYTLLATMMSTRAIANRYLHAKPVIDRLSALVMGGLGLRLLADR